MQKAVRESPASRPLQQHSGRSPCLPDSSAERRQAGTPAATRAAAARPLRLGFLALTDAAPLIVAQERGFFSRHGLAVILEREVGWATIREKIIYGELDAAPAPAPLLWCTELGVGCAPCPVLTALVLNLHGNAITLSSRLWEAGVRDAATLRAEARRRRGENRLTFGVVFEYSSHRLLLRQWLLAAGLRPGIDVRIAVVPPAQTFRNLAAGTLDGYCVGEPWNSLAVQAGAGWCPAWSASLSPGHVEKVLMVRADFAERRAGTHAVLVRALAEACAWCDEPRHRVEIAELLAPRRWLNRPVHSLLPALSGRFDAGHGRIESVPDFHVFSRGGANVPTLARAETLQAELRAAELVPGSAVPAGLPAKLFREDLYHAAFAAAGARDAR
ncbi:MAG TPA: CmpA/NrtA family ABC transporter substrate-binding protein [Opitutus sp.]|nr:CmpA/NrtA family ABC transporter substrate-binding protein [Opitutus sp.]